MNIIKLTSEHTEAVKPIFFNSNKYMGVSNPDPFFESEDMDLSLSEKLYDMFCNTYLTGLISYHAYGAFDDDGNILAFSGFHESSQDPSWYYNMYRGNGDRKISMYLLDKMIEHNEANGRLKFYTLVNKRHTKLLRRFSYSERNNERYDYFDEILIPANHKCFYQKYWLTICRRALVPTDTVVRCSFLKQQYRTEIPIGGNI
jgi:hypothetical protein